MNRVARASRQFKQMALEGCQRLTFSNDLLLGPSSKVTGATPTFADGVKLLTVTLTAGTYTFECTVPATPRPA